MEELDMPRVAHKFMEDLGDPAEKYHLNTAGCLRIFGVKQSTYNGLCKRLAEEADEDSKRAKDLKAKRQEDIKNKMMILEIVRSQNGRVPGHRTLQLLLVIKYQLYLSIKRIRRYKRQMRLMTSMDKNPYKGEDTYLHPLVSPKNCLSRCFYLGYRRVVLVDITYCKYDGGKKVCYHIEFYDPFTDQVLGQATSSSMSVEFVKAAYDEMMAAHGNELRGVKVYLHSDNGSQLLETTFSELLSEDGFIRSVSRPGTPGDNRPMEAKYSRVKRDLEQLLLRCKTVDKVREMLGNYIKDHEENDRCLSLGGLTPNEFEEYILTGVYPLDEYYEIPAGELHPIRTLIDKLKETAHERTERAKKENSEHSKRLEEIKKLQEVEPAIAVNRDRAIIFREKIQCQKEKQSIDTDLKVWEVLDRKVADAIAFILGASPEVLDDLKDRDNWKNYPELQYIYDFPGHKDGKMIVNHKKLGKGISGQVSLWRAVEDFMDGVIRFFDKASDETRGLLEDPANWSLFPELSFLYVLQEGMDLVDGAGI